MTEKRQPYLSYLLRLWPGKNDDSSTWRASLESAQTGERLGFASLVNLLAFLEAEMAAASSGETRLANAGELKEGGERGTG